MPNDLIFQSVSRLRPRINGVCIVFSGDFLLLLSIFLSVKDRKPTLKCPFHRYSVAGSSFLGFKPCTHINVQTLTIQVYQSSSPIFKILLHQVSIGTWISSIRLLIKSSGQIVEAYKAVWKWFTSNEDPHGGIALDYFLDLVFLYSSPNVELHTSLK